jgi:1-deoxy-D-xylulose-5-phosphate reductoisomerase
VAVATHPGAQLLVSAIVGAAGMVPTFAAVSAGKTVALANKESLVAAGELMMSRAGTPERPCCPSTASTTRCTSACAAPTAPRCAGSF